MQMQWKQQILLGLNMICRDFKVNWICHYWYLNLQMMTLILICVHPGRKRGHLDQTLENYASLPSIDSHLLQLQVSSLHLQVFTTPNPKLFLMYNECFVCFLDISCIYLKKFSYGDVNLVCLCLCYWSFCYVLHAWLLYKATAFVVMWYLFSIKAIYQVEREFYIGR